MTRIVLLAHSPLASALRAVASHVYPECASSLEVVDVDPSVTPEALVDHLRSRLGADDGHGTLILVDAFGATPCNAAMQVADGVRVRVVSGVNVPMLWRILCYRHEAVQALVDRALAGGVQGVMHVAEPRRQNQSQPVASPAHDQVEHSHQQ